MPAGSVKVELVRIGNSRGIRIPKPLIEQCGFGDTVELSIERGRLVISPDHQPRQDWNKIFQALGAAVEEQPLLETVAPNEFDHDEWQW